MSNETQLNSHTDLINFTSDYEYVLGATQGRLLQISGLFHSMSFCEEQLQQIRLDLEMTAKNFAELQGLAPGAIGWGYYGKNLDGSPILRTNTGTLYNGIKAVKSGQTIHLRSEARDKYGHYYGGHVEFGHGKVPARPHLRPALYAVSQASQGLLRSALYNLLAGSFNGDMRMAFGTGGGRSASYYRKGPGEIERSLFRGVSGRQASYHFGSIRSGPNISRKAETFRSSFANTAKKSMGWGKQKSLNPVQRVTYARNSGRAGRGYRSQRFSEGKGRMNLARKSGFSLSKYNRIRFGHSFPAHQSSARNYNPSRYKSESKAYKASKQSNYYKNMKKGFSYMQKDSRGNALYHQLQSQGRIYSHNPERSNIARKMYNRGK